MKNLHHSSRLAWPSASLDARLETVIHKYFSITEH